ncbi:MAG: alpha/beta fold hydrolase [Polyangiales bacterium]
MLKSAASLGCALLVVLAFGCDESLGSNAGDEAAANDNSVPTPDAGNGAQVPVAPAVPSPADPGAPYPVVLCHGFFGFDDFANAGFFNYFYKVRETLVGRGHLVFTPTVDPFNDSTVRAEELIKKIEIIVAETGYPRVNLIGHSQGGLDVRAVAALRPDLVESVTTYGTPNTGLALANALHGAKPWDPIRGVLDALVKVVGRPVWGDEIDKETSLAAALDTLSQDGIDAFNAEYPDVPGMAYYSIAGRTDWQQGGPECYPTAGRPDFISKWDRELDPVDPFLAVAEAISDGGLGNPYANDGFIRVTEATWGQFLGCIPADHLDQVGQLIGDSPGLGNDFDHIEFFSDLIDWLHQAGH